MPYRSETWSAANVTAGAYKLSPSLIQQIKGDEPIPATAAALEKVPADLRAKLKVRDNAFYLAAAGANASPGDETQIGDVRIQYTHIKPGPEVSLLARQVKDTFEPYVGSSGSSINRVEMGTKSASAMFQQLEAENTMLTWILRLVGCVLMAAGIALCGQPLVVLFDVLPILGDFVGAGVGIFAIGIALPLSLITIAIAWVAYRPLVGIPLLGVGVLGLVGLFMLGRSRRAAKAAA
jgi:hypothetical protein